jgi:hypothetical protein
VKVNELTFPSWATVREKGWQYAGWIANPPERVTGKTFEELVEQAKQSDHGEVREVDVYRSQRGRCI